MIFVIGKSQKKKKTQTVADFHHRDSAVLLASVGAAAAAVTCQLVRWLRATGLWSLTAVPVQITPPFELGTVTIKPVRCLETLDLSGQVWEHRGWSLCE